MEFVKIAQLNVKFVLMLLHAVYVQLQIIYTKDNVFQHAQMEHISTQIITVLHALNIVESVLQINDVIFALMASSALERSVLQFVHLKLIQMQ